MGKICESCGMPMKKAEDFGGKNPENKYCVHCSDDKGNLKSWEVKLDEFKNFIMRTNDLNEEQATIIAKEGLVKNPAWFHIK